MTEPPPESDQPSDQQSHGQSIRILALLSAGQGLSNFYALSLPPLIPFFKDEFGVSYAALGLMLSVRSFANGIMQFPMGVLVDRIGAKAVVVLGLVLMSTGFGLIAFVPGYWWMLGLAALIGLGMATLRPCHYAIISASMPPEFMGRAFGVNVFAAHAGRAIAPAVIISLAKLWDWRTAMMVMGVAGFVIVAGLVSQWRHVRDDTRPDPKAATPGLREQIRALSTPSILMFFFFFILTAFATNGIHSFTVVALVELHAMPITVATSALTGYLVASAMGVLAGGFMADKITHHGAVAAVALLISAGFLAAMVSVSFPVAVIVALMTLVGLFQGTIRPCRDMLIRAVLPKASFGKAIGIVSTGAAFGGALAPWAFGMIMDVGEAKLVFQVLVISVVLMAVCILIAGRGAPAPEAG